MRFDDGRHGRDTTNKSSARVADTIRNKIINVDSFRDEPAVLMLDMACALVASSLFLTVATKFGLPVSTTYASLSI